MYEIEQTIEIQADHRLIIDIPQELPTGKAKVKLTVIPENYKTVSNENSAFGCLHRFADSKKINDEKSAWPF